MKIIGFIITLTMVFASQAWGADQPKGSGFVENPPSLTPILGMYGAWAWDKASFQKQNYDKIVLDSIEIWLSPDSKYKGIDADQMKVLADSMRAVMIEAMDPDYPVVSQAGAGVLRARLAITNVHLQKPKHRLGQYTPLGFAVTGLRKLAGKSKNISLKTAMVELEMLDSISGERLGVRMDTTPIRTKEEPKEMTWKVIEASLKVYSELFRAGMDRAHGK